MAPRGWLLRLKCDYDSPSSWKKQANHMLCHAIPEYKYLRANGCVLDTKHSDQYIVRYMDERNSVMATIVVVRISRFSHNIHGAVRQACCEWVTSGILAIVCKEHLIHRKRVKVIGFPVPLAIHCPGMLRISPSSEAVCSQARSTKARMIPTTIEGWE